MVPAKPSARAANPFQTFLNYSEYSDDNKIGKEEAEIRQKILPPGEAKFVAPEVLAAMKVALKNARQITIIGFSFNQNDPHIWHEFSGIEYRNDLNINIIDPDFESVRQICEQIFRTKNIIKAASSLREYCESQSM
jgi:hypothetical protein